MKRTIIAGAAIGLLIGSAHFAHADWFNYLVRTSGLGWSDGYHAYDQCPPRQHGHFPVRLPHSFPAYQAAQEHAPYYFEEPESKASQPAEQLPPATTGPTDARLPSPQARYQPHSRYFQALQAEQQGGLPAQPQWQQARLPQQAPPF
jgi:hypothetical protein